MSIQIVGLGPSGLDVVHPDVRAMLTSGQYSVILRTQDHPACLALIAEPHVSTCDDLYESHDEFDAVYEQIVDRVLVAATTGDVIFAVPGSPSVGERTVPAIVERARRIGLDVDVIPAPSFLDLAYVEAGIDPITDGTQILDARDLPDPLPLHVPTFITQVDSAFRAADVSVALGKTLVDDAEIVILERLGDLDQLVETTTIRGLASHEGGPRTTVFVPATMSGVLGLIATNRLLRGSCPWDMKQTHQSLLTHLVEEAYEVVDAIGHLSAEAPLGDIDFGAYAEVEDELGDLLLQVVFHSTLASEAGAFDIDEVAELNRRKLVRRHPHVFGDVAVTDAEEVLVNWEQIKQQEKDRESLMDDIPSGMPSVAKAMKVQKRARSVGFDWKSAEPVYAVLLGEIEELRAAEGDPDAVASELGDVLFSAVNLARQLSVDPEAALRGSVERFMGRFRIVERSFKASGTPMSAASDDELEQAWESAKLEHG